MPGWQNIVINPQVHTISDKVILNRDTQPPLWQTVLEVSGLLCYSL